MATRPIWKHPADVLYRALDFSKVLPVGATVQGTPTYSVSPSGGLTAVHQTTTGLQVVAKLEAGVAGTDYVVTWTVVGSNGETYNRAVTVRVRSGL